MRDYCEPVGIIDRLDYPMFENFDEVRAICDEAHVEPVELDGKSGGIGQAESGSYGLRGPREGRVR